MTILELLQSSFAYVQGYKTRLVAYSNGRLEVFVKDDNERWTVSRYVGSSEFIAVHVFKESEEA